MYIREARDCVRVTQLGGTFSSIPNKVLKKKKHVIKKEKQTNYVNPARSQQKEGGAEWAISTDKATSVSGSSTSKKEGL